MSIRLGIFGLFAAGFVATAFVSGCGGDAPATGGTAVAERPQSEMEYQKQQEQQRQAILPKGKTTAAKKVSKK